MVKATEVFFRKPYVKQGRVQKSVTGLSATKQSHQEECDINTIMAKFNKTGLIAHVRKHQGQYGDFITSVDYHEGLNQILAADAAFNELPAGIRAKFDNDAAAFLEFVQDDANIPEMVEMGLAHNKPEVVPPEPLEEAVESPGPEGEAE